MVERYYNENDELAVLVSPGYGAGWSTWNSADMAIDKDIVEFYLEHGNEDVEAFCEELGYEDVFSSGWKNVVIKWVPSGCLFRVREYDGSESVEIFDERGWFRA